MPIRTICAVSAALLILAAPAFPQSVARITGSVIDSTSKKEIPYASVSILKNDSFFLGTTADVHGKFEFIRVHAGKYVLEITATGYIKQSVPLIIADKKTITLTPVMLAAENNTLTEVTITQLKSLVEDKGDRLVYNAEKDISNSGGTAADLLRKVPSITVDLDGNVQMRGNSNIRILINGKPSSIMSRNLRDALRQMPANIIKTVEVITSPGAKYDAEGAAGVINIITKKGLQGANGNVNATVGNFNKSLGGSFSYKKKKLSVSLSGNVYQYRNKFSRTAHRTSFADDKPESFLNITGASDNTGTGANGELSIDYDFDSSTRINFAANIWGGNFPDNSVSYTSLKDASENAVEAFTNNTRFRNPYGNGQLDLGFTKTLKRPSQELAILAQFSRMPDNYFYDNILDYEGRGIIKQHSENYSRNKEYTAQADYTHPFKIYFSKDTADIKLEMGTKLIHRDIGSEYYLSTAAGDGPLTVDPAQTNIFDYKQNVYSGYTSLRIETKKRWVLSAGLRLERTTLDGAFESTQTVVNTAFNNFVPSVTLSRTLSKHTVRVSYTQRIRRPMIWNLNPWRNESDPKNIWTGNPYLLPEVNHAFELGHTITGEKNLSLNSTLYVRRTSTGIEYITNVDSAGILITAPQNIGKRSSAGIDINFSIQPNAKWNFSTGSDFAYVDLKTANSTLRNSGVTYRFTLNTAYKLPHDYTIQANGNFFSGWIGLQVKNSPWYWYGISAKKEFWDKKAGLTLGVNNPFNNAFTQKLTRTGQGFIEHAQFVPIVRSVRLSFEWRFGQMSTDAKRSRKITNDDTGR